MHFRSVGQKFGDLSELRDITVGFLIIANPIVRVDQIRINKVATKGILSPRRKFMRRWIRC